MIDPTLESQLEPVARRYRRARQLYRAARVWAALAIVGAAVLLVASWTGLGTTWIVALLAVAGAGLAYRAWRREGAKPTDWRGLARLIERRHPELGSLLVTAVEQSPDSDSGRLNYLQEQIVRQAFYESRKRSWVDAIPDGKYFAAQCFHWGALGIFVAELVLLGNGQGGEAPVPLARGGSVEIIPGDTEVERGRDVTILARFPERRVPSNPEIIVQTPLQSTRRISLEKNLDDPVFSTTLKEIGSSLTYRVAYEDETTRDFKIEVFSYPALQHADAHLTYPDFTGLASETLKDTQRISAVEGSQLRYSFFVNKPVASARLVPREGEGGSVELAVVSSNHFQTEWTLDEDRAYDLILTDQEGRSNQSPPRFQIDVLKNQKPSLQFAFPSGDQKVSPLEEIAFEAVASDDFGLKRYGLAFSRPGKEARFVELGGTAEANTKKELSYLLSLEELSVEPDQLISYYLWAEDVDPSGEVRRSYSDLHFVEVRPFEEVFREGPSTASSQSQSSSGQGGGGSPIEQLVELQKKVINATWNLRDKASDLEASEFEEQKSVVVEAQREASKQLAGLKARLRNPNVRSTANEAEKAMSQALNQLQSATQASSAADEASSWAKALEAEQTAYQALLRIQGNEHLVTQGRQGGGGGGSSGGSRAQRQLDQLELKQSENRYETERQASGLNNPQQQERLDIMNQLEKLAQRQGDLNERLKELQTALQAASSDEEKEAIRRRLKRLQEEERQALRELDEVRQRLAQQQSPETAESLSRLDKTRSELQKAAEELEKESVSRALASGSRVQQDLQEVKEGLRKESSSEFAGALREIRSRARALVEREEAVQEQFKELDADAERALSGGAAETLAQRLSDQREKATELLDQIETVSDQAESAEPLLSRQLYEALRQADQSEGAKQVLPFQLWEEWHDPDMGNLENSLRLSRKLLNNKLKPLAEEVEKKAYDALVQLKMQVESTTDEVLGSELETLRLARNELDDLVRDVEEEMRDAPGSRAPGGERPSEQGGAIDQDGRQGSRSDLAQGEQQERQEQQAGAGSQREEGDRRQAQSAQSQASQAGEEGQRAQASSEGRQETGQSGQQARSQQSQSQQGRSDQRAQSGERPGDSRSEQSASDGSRLGGDRRRLANDARGGGAGGGGDRRAGTDRGGLSSTLEELERQLMDEVADSDWNGPISGEGFGDWLERLRNLREMLGEEAWRRQLGQVVDRARSMRAEVKRNNQSPKWSMVESEIIGPLTELRDRIGEELARLQSKDALVPLERDPVPREYSEFVREYYERLGSSEDEAPRR